MTPGTSIASVGAFMMPILPYAAAPIANLRSLIQYCAAADQVTSSSTYRLATSAESWRNR